MTPAQFQIWAKRTPPPWRSAIASRTALRILPLGLLLPIQESTEEAQRIPLTVFRVGFALWVNHKYASTRATVQGATQATHAAKAIAQGHLLPSTQTRAAFSAIASSISLVGRRHSARAYAELLAEMAAATMLEDAVWTSIGADTTWLLERNSNQLPNPELARDLASQPLWVQDVRGDKKFRVNLPIWARRAWDHFKEVDRTLGGDFAIWIRWYEGLLRGGNQTSLGASLIGEAAQNFDSSVAAQDRQFWQGGAHAVNDRIKQLIPFANLPHISNDKPPSKVPLRPAEPLPSSRPATRFAVVDGRIHIALPEVWKDRETQASFYHVRARQLTEGLIERLSKTDAVPDVANAVAALDTILGDRIESVQPDQLRLASRSIAAKARAYGHPSAQWEIGADSVGAIFELADVLVDLQSFARTEIEANERAIRQLDLSPTQAAAAKGTLDEITDALTTIPEIVTGRVETAFATAGALSATSLDSETKIAVESERILLTENLALSVARGLGASNSQEPRRSPVADSKQRERLEPQNRKSMRAAQQFEWDEFKGRLLTRLNKNAPEKIADAALDAAVSSIKHSPKTIAGFGAALVVWWATSPVLFGASGLGLTMTWIGYQLYQRSKQKSLPHERKGSH